MTMKVAVVVDFFFWETVVVDIIVKGYFFLEYNANEYVSTISSYEWERIIKHGWCDSQGALNNFPHVFFLMQFPHY